MIAGNAEEIALVITGRDEGGSAALRSVTAAAKQSEAEIKRSAAALASYARTVDVSNAQAVAGFRESAAAERELLVETRASSVALDQLAVITQAFEKRVDASAAATERQARALGQAEVAAYKEADALSRANVEQGKIPGQARSGANGLAVLSLAMVSGAGSAQSLALAAGLAASSILAMSKNAKIAASANGVGALLTLLAVYYETVQKLDKVDPIPQAFTDRLAQQGLAAVKANVQSLKQERENLLATLPNINANDRRERLRDIELLSNEITAAYQRQVTLEGDARRKTRETGVREESADERRRKADAERAQVLTHAIAEADEAANQVVSKNHLANEIARINKEFNAREDEIQKLRIQTAEKNRLLIASRTLRVDEIGAVRREDASLQEEKRARAVEVANAQIQQDTEKAAEFTAKQQSDSQAERTTAYVEYYAELRKIRAENTGDALLEQQQEEAATRLYQARITEINRQEDIKRSKIVTTGEQTRVAVITSAVDQVVRAHKLSIRELIRAGLQPKITDLEGDAISHFTKAASAAFTGDFAKAFGETAAGGKSLAGAAALSALGEGLSSRGGGGGGGGASGSTGADSFTPRGQSGAGGGDIHITFLSEDQLSPGKVNALRFQINRADVLDKPMQYTAPGGSLTVRAA